MQGNIFIDQITGRYNYNPMLYGYFNTGETHIILGCRRAYLQKLIKFLENKHHHSIHLFVMDPYVINRELDELVDKCVPQNKLTIHIPIYTEDMYPVMKYYFKDNTNIRIFKEKKGPKFSIKQLEYPHGEYFLQFDYTDQGVVGTIKFMFHNYMNYECGCDKDSALSNRARIKYPELFKDDIIKSFKETTPPKILEVFKTDDEIWEYLTPIIKSRSVTIANDR